MAATRTKRWTSWVAVVPLLVAACSQVAPVSGGGRGAGSQTAADAPASSATQVRATAIPTAVKPTAAPTPVVGGPTAVVRRGSIAEILQLNGRVAGVEEQPLAFTQSTSLARVLVKPGDSVDEGQVLAEGETKQIAQALKDANNAVDAATARLEVAKRSATGNPSQPDSSAAPEEALRQAQADLAKVQAGSSDLERQGADAAVVNARAALDKAEADLARAKAGAAKADVLAAEQQRLSAQLVVQQAESDAARLANGPEPEQVRSAERQLADAQAALVAAQANLDALTRGPDQYELRSAQREVDKAQASLQAAKATNPDPQKGGTSDSRESSVAAATFALQEAQDKLAKLREPPKPEQLVAMRTKVDDAAAGVASAQEKLDAIRKPDQLAIDKANAAVNSARLALQAAEDKLQQVKTGASEDQLSLLAGAVETARVGLATAESKRDDIYSRPTPADLDAAQRRVAAAKAALDRVRQPAPSADRNATTPEQVAAQKELQQAQERLASLQSDMEASRLRAPWAGTVVGVPAQVGQALEPGTPAVVIAKPGEPIVVVNLPAASSPAAIKGRVSGTQLQLEAATRVAAGQSATIQIDGSDGAPLTGSVIGVSGSGAAARVAQLRVDWASTSPVYGSTAFIQLTVQQKYDALLVPVPALRSSGDQKYVEFLQGKSRQATDVQVGITTDTDVEILNGLSEGQTVFLTRPAPIPTSVAQAAPTPTVHKTPTPVAQAAPMAVAQSMRPVLDERFSDAPTAWPDDRTLTAWLDGGSYHLSARQPSHFVAVAAPLPTLFDDVTISAVFHKEGGPPGGGYGIIIRDQDPAAHDGLNQNGAFYVLEVGDAGEVGIWRRDGDRWIDVLPWTRSDAVHSGQAENELRVQAVGDRLTFDVNGKHVADQTQAVLPKGGVGVFVGGDNNEVSLTHFTVEAPQ